MAVHEPQLGPPPPAWNAPQRALPASGTGEDHLSVPGSELSALVDATDWSAGPLGDPVTWPQSLRTAVGICLSSRFPMLLWWGPELVMIYNDAYRPMLGESKHPRALGAPGREVWTEIWDVIGPMLDQVMAGGGATWSADQLLVLDRNGYAEECYFTFSYSPVADESGGVGGVFCAVTETTERVVGERRLATLAEMAGLMGASSRPEVVRTAASILGANSGDHPEVMVLDAPPEGDRAALVERVGEQLPGVGAGTRARVADLVRQASGTGRAVSTPADDAALTAGVRAWHAYAVGGTGGGGAVRGRGAAVIVLGESVHRPWDASLEAYATLCATHVAAALADVRQLSEERRRREALVELDAAKSAFFTNLSHELRTPLTLIAGPVQEALEVADDPAQRQRLELVERNTHRLARMVDAMLDFGRMEAGGLAPQLEEVDVSALAKGLAESFRPAVERAGLAFSHDCGEGIEGRLDRDMVERIVLNLLSNAVKYTPDGSVALTVREVDDDIEISVRDTGVGIHPDDVERAFARFERLPAAAGARSHEGAGIGLAMVQQLTELMGGEVSLASEEGEGSVFTVRLPARPPAPDAGATRPSSTMTPRRVDDFLREVQTWQQPAGSSATLSAPTGTPASRSGRPRVLVAEDNADLRTYLGDVLGDEFDVELVADGSAALDAALRETPDLVLSDVMMPGLDGYGLVDAIRTEPTLAGVPVVLLSARAGDTETSTALGSGADDYLVKPFSVLELRARVASNLERAAARTQDASWRRALVDGLHDALLVLDLDGTVLEVNDRFTGLLGWSAADGPFTPPYPWDVADAGVPGGFADAVDRAAASHEAAGPVEAALLHRDGRRLVGSVRVSLVDGGRRGPSRLLATVHDVTAEHEARERRATAASLAAELGAADELTDVVAAAVAGLSVLFSGDTTVRVAVGRKDHVFTASGPLVRGDLDPEVAGRLDADGPDGEGGKADDSRARGILLSAGGGTTRCRVWVSFPEARAVTADERIAGDLLVQALALACDRVLAASSFAEREQHLRRAVESHEQIGQAVGILVERHRWTPTTAFEHLKRTSQDHNIKLREVAQRVIESGAVPDGETS